MVWHRIKSFFNRSKEEEKKEKKQVSEEDLITQKLETIQQLMYQRSFEQALEEIHEFENSTSLEDYSKLRCQVWKAQCWIDHLHDYGPAFSLTKKLLKELPKKGNFPIIALDNIIVLLNCFWHYDQFDEEFKAVLKEGEKIIQSLPDNEQKIRREAPLLKFRGLIELREDRDLDEVVEYFLQSLSLFEKIGDKLEYGDTIGLIAGLYFRKGDLDNALKNYERALDLFREVENEVYIAGALNSMGGIYWEKGEIDKALDYFLQALAIREKEGLENQIAGSLNNVGLIYGTKGELDKALEYFTRTLEHGKKIQDKRITSIALANIGKMYFLKGLLKKALSNYQEAKKLLEELRLTQHLPGILGNIGDILAQQGKYDEAITNYQKMIEIVEPLENKLILGSALAKLVKVSLVKNELEQAKQYLERLETINQEVDNRPLDQFTRLAKALVLKRSPRLIHKGKALEILQQLAEDEVLTFELTVEALIHLCDMLLNELKQTGEPSILNEIKPVVQKLLEIAQNQGSYSVLAEAKLLQSQLALLELDISKAKNLLNEAQILAEEKGLKRLAMSLSNEHDTLIEQSSKWEELVNRNASLQERLEMARMEEQILHLIQGKEFVEVQQEDSILLLILNENGLTIFSKNFVPDSQIKEQLISGFLSAINSFIREAFSTSGMLERIKHKEYNVLLESKESILFSYVYKGPSYHATNKIRKFINQINQSSSLWNSLITSGENGVILQEDKQAEVKRIAEEIFLSDRA